METLERKEFRTPDGKRFRVSIYPDYDIYPDYYPESPRDMYENIALLLSNVRDYNSPDKGDVEDYAPFTRTGHYGSTMIDCRRTTRYINLFRPDVLAHAYFGQGDRGLDGPYFIDGTYGNWDPEWAYGIAVVTRESWDRMMGADYAGEVTPRQVIESEVEAFNRWAQGYYCGFVVEEIKTCDLGEEHFEHLDSCLGFDDADYAMDEGKGCLPDDAEEV